MQPENRNAVRRTPHLVVLVLALSVPAATAGPADCETRTMRVTFYTCGEGSSHCLTRVGHQPIPFRTVAVGDKALLGRWLYIEDLGGWVLASDTGVALKPGSLDVFIGEGRMAQYAKRLGVQFWMVRVCAPAPVEPASPPARGEAEAAREARDAGAPGAGGAPR
jgi:3D (Asp-Asp-Asp) domain-containing protein